MIGRIKFDIDALADEVLDHLPEEVWTSSTTTFLDPALGGGQFVRRIEARLREAGHSDDNIRGRVFGFEKSDLNIRYAVNKYSLVGQYSCVSHDELFERGLEDILSEKGLKVKPDVIIGNPPYNGPTSKEVGPGGKKLWPGFIDLALSGVNENGWVSFLTPAGCFKSTVWNVPQQLIEVGTGRMSLKYIDVDANRHFNVGIPICNWIIQNKPYDKATSINGEILDLSERFFIPREKTASGLGLVYQIIDKLTVHPTAPNFNFVRKHVDADCVIGLTRLNHISKNGKYQVHRGSSDLNYVLSSENEVVLIEKYLSHPLYRWVNVALRHDSVIYHGFINGFKHPVLETYVCPFLFFGLTKEEIDYIERTVK